MTMKKPLLLLPHKQLRELADQYGKVVEQVQDLQQRGDAVPARLKRRQARMATIVGAASGEYATRSDLAKEAKVCRPTLNLWLRRAAMAGAPEVADAPRPGRPHKLTASERKAVFRKVRSRNRRQRGKPSLAQLAEMYDISRMTLWRLLRSVQRRDPKK